MRKTLDRQRVVDNANRVLALDSVSKDVRAAIAVFLESVLMAHDSYAGFTYLSSEFTPLDSEGNTDLDEADFHYPALRKGYDDTRRRYF